MILQYPASSGLVGAEVGPQNTIHDELICVSIKSGQTRLSRNVCEVVSQHLIFTYILPHQALVFIKTCAVARCVNFPRSGDQTQRSSSSFSHCSWWYPPGCTASGLFCQCYLTITDWIQLLPSQRINISDLTNHFYWFSARLQLWKSVWHAVDLRWFDSFKNPLQNPVENLTKMLADSFNTNAQKITKNPSGNNPSWFQVSSKGVSTVWFLQWTCINIDAVLPFWSVQVLILQKARFVCVSISSICNYYYSTCIIYELQAEEINTILIPHPSMRSTLHVLFAVSCTNCKKLHECFSHSLVLRLIQIRCVVVLWICFWILDAAHQKCSVFMSGCTQWNTWACFLNYKIFAHTQTATISSKTMGSSQRYWGQELWQGAAVLTK